MQQVGPSVNIIAECTLPEKILLAAFQLEEKGESPFSAEALIVTAWQKYPRTFGLKGYAEQYPDANKVLATIMGEKGLARRGWLIKMGQKLYAMTRDGRQVVRRLMQDEDEAPLAVASAPVKLPADHDKLLQTLLGSSAVQKYREGRKQEMNFADACRFWNITEHLESKVLDERLETLARNMILIERELGTATSVLGNGRTVEPADITLLSELHDYLEERFSRHLMLLRNRAGRR
jgi:hypothetical protein